ncbi:hypothetical protein BBJ28_00020589, partial [Nothophytophthora sp. Chile5]
MRVQFFPPAHLKPEGVNGAPVLGYKVEVAHRVNEVQTFAVTANGPIIAGEYKLTFTNGLGEEVTSCIPWNASEVEFELALEELPNVDSVGVSRSTYSSVKNGYVYTVTFDGEYLVSGQQANTLVGDTVGCRGTQPLSRVLSFEGAHITTGAAGYYPEVWEIVSEDSSGEHLLGGSFDISVGFEGDWEAVSSVTATIAAGSRTAKTSASMLGRVNRGDKVRIGAEEFVVHAAAPFTDSELPLDSYHVHGATAASIEVLDTALGNVQVTKNSNIVVTSRDFTADVAVGEQIKISMWEFDVVGIAAGSIEIAEVAGGGDWSGATTLHTTAYKRKKVRLDASADAAEMKRAINGLPSVGSIDVSRVGPTRTNGYRWYVTFQSLGSLSCPTSPCLRVEKPTGTTEFIDVCGVDCSTCAIRASVLKDETQINTLHAIEGDYAGNAIVVSQEVGGVVIEVQTISTQAESDDIKGSFAVKFQTVEGAVINYDDTAMDVRTKLQNLATVGRLNVTRTENAEFGVTWTISFLSNLGDMPLFVVYDKSMLKGTGVDVVVREVVKGVDVSFEAIIGGLAPGQDYYVRAFARNANGYGSSTSFLQHDGKGALPLSTSMASSPEAPSITGLWPLSGSQLELRLSSPVDHGDSVSKYLFEYAVGENFGVPAIKKLFVFNSRENDIAGTFRLQYGDDVSSMLPIDATASSLQNALNSLPCLRPVSVTRGVYALTGEASSRVIGFSADSNRLLTTVLTASQSQLLVKGAVIEVGSDRLVVRSQPLEGSLGVDVDLVDGLASFTEDRSVLKVDDSGSERGPSGYEWRISFDNDAGTVVHGKYPGLQLLSSLTSVETGLALSGPTLGFADHGQDAVPADHYGYFEINNNEQVCDTYVIGGPSSVQVIQLFGQTTTTEGTFKLMLGAETTQCITLGNANTKSSLKTELEALEFVSKVTVEEVREFKVTLLVGSASSKVVGYSGGLISVVGGNPANQGLSDEEAAVLPKDTIIQVSRNPNDFSRHSCEFIVNADSIAGHQTVSVTAVEPCTSFSGEARTLKILDFHDYKIRFWGHYPTGEWPTLQFDSAAFGDPDAVGDGSMCDVWKPTLPIPRYGQVHTIKYEGVCAKGQSGVQTILADASTAMGGTFTLSYMGNETLPLLFQGTMASEMREAIDSITAPGAVNVSLSRYGSYGKAWHITFVQDLEDQDAIFIKHSRLTGQNALISVYPTVEVFTDAKQDDISGSFRIRFGDDITEAIGFSATHMKVTQELQKLDGVDSVLALGDEVAGDIGVYGLKLTADADANSPVLSNVILGENVIDPTRFLAIGEKVLINAEPYYIRSMTLVDITLTEDFGGTAGNVEVSAGLITKQTKPLPGFVGISPLMQVIAVANGHNTFELPADHGYVVHDVFFVGGVEFTITVVANTIVTTSNVYAGDTVAAANPTVYVFDNKLRTTDDLTELVSVDDELWLRSKSADFVKYTVTVADPRYLKVDGIFTDTIIKERAYYVASGRKWVLVFRSYIGDLATFDALPANDWRGTDARIGARHPKAIAPNVINVGNPASTQTVLLEVADGQIATTYTLGFGGEATNSITWSTTGDDLKTALEDLDTVDGVTVTSLEHGNGFVHTISFWGTYPMAKLPLLEGASNDDTNLNVFIRGDDAVAVTKQDHLILESSQNYAFRIFAENSKGVSDAVSIFQAHMSASSVVPSPPTAVCLGEFHGPTWLSINYWAPLYSGGADVTMYRIEWDSSPIFDSASADYGVASIQKRFEEQHVATSYRSPTGVGGTFTLSWGGSTTSALPFDCSATEMTEALAIITETSNIAVDPVKVTRARLSWGFAWKIKFLHNPGDLAPLVADGIQLTGDFPRIRVGEVVQGFNDLAIGDFTHEVQDVFTDGQSTVGGFFTLMFDGKTTGSISVDASALEMQTTLQQTTTLYSIKVSKATKNSVINTAIWSVTFAYLRGEEMVGAGNIFTMTVADASLLTGTGASILVANKITGSDPFQYTLTSLRPGVRYYSHVMAYNADGFGSATSPLSSAVTCGQPQPPKSVTASVVDGTTLAVAWSASAEDGNWCSVDKYKVEWYRAEGTQEQQVITTSAGKGLPEIQRLVDFADSQTIGGYFKLSFGGESTENIMWNAEAVGLNSVKERLERLSTIGTVDVSRQDSVRVVGGFLVTTTSTTTLRRHSSSTITTVATSLAVDDVIWVAGQQLKITGIHGDDLTVDPAVLEVDIPMPVFTGAFGYEWRITFLSGHVGPQDLIQVLPTDSWTGNNPGIAVESFQKGLQPISGTFRVSFASGGISDTTPPLPHNSSAMELKDALESLSTIGIVNVTRSANGYGYNWIVTFVSEFKDAISLLVVDGTELQGPSVRILAARTQAGVQPPFYCEYGGITGAPAEITLPATLRYVINELKTGQKYAIRVRAHNTEGFGGAAYISPSFQIPRTTPSVPTDVQLLVLSSRFLKVRWYAPASDGGSSITTYKVQWDTSSGFPNVGTPNYDFQEVLHVTPTDTSPFYFNIPVMSVATYFVRVFALNDQGESAAAATNPSYARPSDRTPGQPEEITATVLSSYAILVEWKASSMEKYYYGGDGGLPITQYMVEWDTSAAFDSPASFGLVNGTMRSFIIGGDDIVTGMRSDLLLAGASYSVRVTAFNARGAGAPKPSVPASVIAANQPPTAPQQLKLSVASATSIQADWTNPLFDGGASLKAYQIEWDEQEDFSSGQSSSATIPIVREMQSVIVQNDVVNEEQFVDATVEVVNEEQVVRT